MAAPTDTTPILTLLTSQPALPALLALPLTTYPAPLYTLWTAAGAPLPPTNPLASNPDLSDGERTALHHLQKQIVATLFDAVAGKNVELVTALVEQGFVSPDVPDAGGRTPLIAAVEAGNGAMVCALVALGARVGGYGTVGGAERTPLMVAAARGNLALAKLLMEDFGADDGVIAPDGQLALRLAADGGHRDVVAYLPARRGGAWRRWKSTHAVAWRRVTRAAGKVWWFFEVLLYEIPKFFLWSVPKHVVVKPLWEGGKYCWENKHKFGGWCKRQAKAFPGRVKRAGKAVWKGMKKVPKGVWSVAKEIPGVIKRLVKWLWKVITRIPAAMKKLCVWIWESLKRVGKAVGHVFMRVVAALHTTVAAVLDFFRTIKLKDVWNGFCEVFNAIFRGLPKVLWKIVYSSGILVAGIIIGLFGLTGKLVVFLIEALWYVAKYVPRQLGEIIAGIWTSIAKGYHEILVWINPKH
ncbi:hypothetical protein NEMBOFW57_002181 [Staphylotrichum longicolle]|uniref:Uncharacterized protein n=1 Tax=Staphylotrichum longicolle TaxID=669026 RepID=A0AAD4F308_9PEZI|nr:hypothetical protein NEMBOFW57_002181 [Staphylotrichum longicolle]